MPVVSLSPFGCTDSRSVHPRSNKYERLELWRHHPDTPNAPTDSIPGIDDIVTTMGPGVAKVGAIDNDTNARFIRAGAVRLPERSATLAIGRGDTAEISIVVTLGPHTGPVWVRLDARERPLGAAHGAGLSARGLRSRGGLTRRHRLGHRFCRFDARVRRGRGRAVGLDYRHMSDIIRAPSGAEGVNAQVRRSPVGATPRMTFEVGRERLRVDSSRRPWMASR